LRQRLNPHRASDASREPELAAKYGLDMFQMRYDARISDCKIGGAMPSDEDILRMFVGREKMMIYSRHADEIGGCPKSLFTALKPWSRKVHQFGPGKVALTMPPVPELYDDGNGKPGVDYWVMLPVQFEEHANAVAEVKAANGKKGRFWSYNCLVQDDYSPKWVIDMPPIQPRIHGGFINQALEITGLLYWRIDLYADTNRWDDPYKYGCESYGCFPGDGVFMWPGKEVGASGAVAGMRLKWIRDSIDDFDYIQILKKHSKAESDWVMAMVAKVAKNFRTWTKSESLLERVRKAIGYRISRLSKR